MPFLRFLTYSLLNHRPVRVLLSEPKMMYANLTVILMEDDHFVALKAGRKAPVVIPYDQVLAVSYARGDDGDTMKRFFQQSTQQETEEEHDKDD